VTIIYLVRQLRLRVAERPVAPEATGCDYYPRIHLSSTLEREAGYLSPLFVLHRMGFFLRPGLRRNPVGSYPAFSPLPSTFFTTLNKVNVAIMKEVLGGLFSVTLSVTRGFRLECPRFSRGIPPFGVRTFLYPENLRSSDRPSTQQYTIKVCLCHPSLSRGVRGVRTRHL
jgi:hypothetical protein